MQIVVQMYVDQMLYQQMKAILYPSANKFLFLLNNDNIIQTY